MAMWYTRQDPEDPQPWALAYVGDDGLWRRYVPGIGLVPWPSMADASGMGGFSGSRVISEAEAVRLMPQLPPVTEDQLQMFRADGPVLPAPT